MPWLGQTPGDKSTRLRTAPHEWDFRPEREANTARGLPIALAYDSYCFPKKFTTNSGLSSFYRHQWGVVLSVCPDLRHFDRFSFSTSVEKRGKNRYLQTGVCRFLCGF
jgi:hypothetical protein